MPSSLQSLVDIWKFRVRLALALRESAADTLATPAELDHLVAVQTAHWESRRLLSGPALQQVLSDLNDRSVSAFVFSVRQQRVWMWKKHRAGDGAGHSPEQRGFLKRAQLYQAFLTRTLERSAGKARRVQDLRAEGGSDARP